MPIYEYRRKDGSTFEVIQKFSDDALTKDPETGEPVERVYSAPAIHFKGSGFHNTDYSSSRRARAGGGGDSGGGDGGGGDSGGGDSGGGDSSSGDGGGEKSSGSSDSGESKKSDSGSSGSTSSSGSESAPKPSAKTSSD